MPPSLQLGHRPEDSQATKMTIEVPRQLLHFKLDFRVSCLLSGRRVYAPPGFARCFQRESLMPFHMSSPVGFSHATRRAAELSSVTAILDAYTNCARGATPLFNTRFSYRLSPLMDTVARHRPPAAHAGDVFEITREVRR